MDQDGLFLVLSMCNACRTAKGSWKKCMSKRHNPKLATVSQENLTFAHRQCVKPDQTMTIYKLRNRETNEELLEFSEDIVFQTPCPSCTSIKGCLKAGHRLQDWKPIFNDPPGGAPLPNGDAAGGGGEDEETPVGTAKGSGSVKSSSAAAGGAPGGSLSSGGKSKRNDKAIGGAKGGAGSGAVGAKAGNGRASLASASGSAVAGDISHNLSGTPKLPHKRKSPGPVASPPAKASRVVTPKSSSSSSSQKSLKGLQKETNAKRGSKDKKNPPSEIGGNGHRILGVPKLELDDGHAASEGKERPLKRRNRHGIQAAGVTPNCGAMGSNSHGTSGVSKVEGKSISSGSGEMGNKKTRIVATPENGEATVSAVRCSEIDGTKGAEVECHALTQQQQQQQQRDQEVRQDQEERPERVPKVQKPERRKTIAERLEDVKAEESKLLVEFEATHKKCEKEEEAKREEMIEFQRAGEAAIREMRKRKEEALRWIASRRQKIAAERESLVKLRMKELEAEQERARRDAQEREEKLEAEKKALTEAWSKQDSARPERCDPWDDGWSSSSIFDLAKIPSADVRGRLTSHEDASDAFALKTPCEGGGAKSPPESRNVISGAAVEGSKSSSGQDQSQQSVDRTDTNDGCDGGSSVPTVSKPGAPTSVCESPAEEASTGGVGVAVGVGLASRSANTSMVDAHAVNGKALLLPPEAKAMNPRGEEGGSWSVGPARLANALATPVTSTTAPSNGGGASGDRNVKGSLVCPAAASNHAGAATDGAAVQKECGSEEKATKADPVKGQISTDSNELPVRASKGVVPMVGRPGVAAR